MKRRRGLGAPGPGLVLWGLAMETRWKHIMNALESHWPEYLMEAAGLGMFMISACLWAVALEYPGSPLRDLIPVALARRTIMGVAMGLTAIAIIYSPWGQQSGAHLNPAVTLTFLRLGKVPSWDAMFYVVAQFVGGLAGVFLVASVLRGVVAHPAINYVATVPGRGGGGPAFLAEVVISFCLMLTVLTSSNRKELARYTGLFAGLLIAVYITVEAPVSGMSMNPARSFASALPAHLWRFIWIYFTAPPLGMLLAAELYIRWRGLNNVFCAKLNHENNKRCIFRCRYGLMSTR